VYYHMNIIKTSIRKYIDRFLFSHPEKSTVTFKGSSQSPLILPTHTVIGYLGGIQVCSFEHLQWSERAMSVGHFGVMEQYIGMDIGTLSIRAFAALISKHMPQIVEIRFELSQASPLTNIELLANARVMLLEKIGATEINIHSPTSNCYVVTGIWQKSQWKYTP
jgi:hypothetical protein